MFVTKKHIPRRTFLRGAGVTLALPLLDSMVPALTPLRLTAAAPVTALRRHLASARRLARLLEPAAGRARTSTSRSSPSRSEPFRNRVVLITGLDMPEAMATDEEPGGDHARGAVLLSGARPRRNAVSPYLGVTDRPAHRAEVRPGHDPVVDPARRRRHRQLRQLQLGLQLRLHQLDLVGVADAAAADAGQSARGVRASVRRRHQSGRTAEGAEAERQHPRLGDARAGRLQERSRRRRPRALDTYVENIRELERRIRIAMENSVKEPEGDVPFGLPDSKHVHFRLMYDLMALAFEGDITRSATFMLGRDLSGTSFPESGFERRLARHLASRRQAGERRRTTPRSTAITCRTWPTSATS